MLYHSQVKFRNYDTRSTIVEMARQHGAAEVEAGWMFISAWFPYEDDRDEFEDEFQAYDQQQAWFSSLTEEEAAALGLAL